ncbi:chromobox protein homolog 1-like [Drosophila innubila]|uniref:chromobox protein homolog 1-like n=1 Tax=Drosophila innubila TaxID=198719 RepID=UPI00148DAA66|nr:chromobox protein homolog 1-like [Drosophila innubila]
MEEEYKVERIEKKRVVNGVTEYYLKWKGYPRDQNTWEPIDHLYCKDLVDAFEKCEKRKAQSQKRLKLASEKMYRQNKQKAMKSSSEDNTKFGFDREVEASKILGATNTSGQLMFLMTFKNSDKRELVPAKLANVMCPQIVIKFYEERLTWEIPYAEKVNNNKSRIAGRAMKKEKRF